MKRSVINVFLFSFMSLAAVACTAGGGEGMVDKTEDTSVSENVDKTEDISVSESSVSTDGSDTISDVDSLEFSKAGGFYDDPFELEIRAPEGMQIYYTLDGSEPDSTGLLYDGPIEITDRSPEKNDLSARKKLIPPSKWGPEVSPSEPVDKATVVRAASFDASGRMSESMNATYFVDYDQKAGFYKDMKVISLITDPDNLFDSAKGIYVLGDTYDKWKNGPDYDAAMDEWVIPANYHERGRDWERPAIMQFFDKGEPVYETAAGIRTHGGSSRAVEQKSFNVYLRKDYGAAKLEYDLFDGANISEANGDVIDKYDSFVLRNGGNDCKFSRIRDKLIQGLVNDRKFLTLEMEPCIVFIDGEFWGHYEITEKITDEFISDHYDVDKKNVVIIKNSELEDGEEADLDEFNGFREWIKNSDLSDPAKYEELNEQIDMEAFAEYMSTQIYICNYDLSEKNICIWKVREPVSDEGVGDGRWHFILFDTEYSSSLYDSPKPDLNIIEELRDKDCFVNDLFFGALENEEFRKMFSEKYEDISRNNFEDSRVDEAITALSTEYKEFTYATYDRFWPVWPGGKNVEINYAQQISGIRKFYKMRRTYCDRHVAQLLEGY